MRARAFYFVLNACMQVHAPQVCGRTTPPASSGTVKSGRPGSNGLNGLARKTSACLNNACAAAVFAASSSLSIFLTRAFTLACRRTPTPFLDFRAAARRFFFAPALRHDHGVGLGKMMLRPRTQAA